MSHRRLVTSFLTLLALLLAAGAFAQTGDGSLRGYIKDEQAGALPGATVTATSPVLLRPLVAATDAEGYYRIINLPPGEYVLTVELAGFTTTRREGVLLRSGANFQVDFSLKIGALEETITVAGESPMLEISKPGNVLNVDGDFQKQMPIAARRNWTDFLELAPGVHSRPFDDGSGRMVYFGHATEHFAHVVQLEGMQAGNYNDFQLTYIQMGADMIEDTQVKTGGVDASTPMGTGLAINVVTKSGGNQLRGTAGWAYQPLDWNGNNTSASTVFKLPPELAAISGCPNGECISTGGSPAGAVINQFDISLGGPIRRDRVWFFGAFRYSDLEAPISRIDKQINDIKNFFPDRQLFNNLVESYQPYGKVTAKLGAAHELTGVYQRDRLNGTPNWEWYYDPVDIYGNGGDLYSVKLASVWGRNITTTLLAGYNNKGGADESTWEAFPFQGSGPRVEIYEGTRISSGLITGNNLILEGANRTNEPIVPASLITIRGDLTWYKTGWGGSHEFQTGVFLAPNNTYDQLTRYTESFDLERQSPVNYNRPELGTRPFYRRYRDPLEVMTRRARDSDYGVYLQDTWKPNNRLTANIGLRVDFVKRVDELFNITRQESTEVQPRMGFSYLLTQDAKNVLRGSYVRVAEQVMGRDAITTFGADSKVTTREEYDNNLDGVFETVRLDAAAGAAIAAFEIDSANTHQPYLDEFIVGFRRQFLTQMAMDVAFISRSYKHMWATIDVNGFYPEGPGQPFGGFGRVDPNRGIVNQQTNNTWSSLEYRALELTVTKNLRNNWQFMAGFNRQWHHMSGTWNPTDPARFVEPDAFANDGNLYMPRGNNDSNSLPNTGNALSYGPTWMKYRGNIGGTWLAPYGIRVAGTYTIQAGPWSGALLTQLAANDPDVLRFGRASFQLENGTTQPNPLATRNRYVYNTRGEGQIRAPAIHTVGLKVGKVFGLGSYRNVEIAGNVFNLLNGGDFTQFTYNSAYQSFSSNFLQMRNRQPARAVQLTIVTRF
jgi:hypothetical protein